MTIQEIKNLVINNNLDEAINLFSILCKGNDTEDIVLQIQSRFNHYRQEKMKGVLSVDDEFIQRNRISASILESIKEYEKSQPAIKDHPKLIEEILHYHKKLNELYKIILLGNSGGPAASAIMNDYFSQNSVIAKDLSKIESKISALNQDSSARTVEKKVIDEFTLSLRKSTERITKKLRGFQKEIVNKAIDFSVNSLERNVREIGYIYQVQGSGLINTLTAFVSNVLGNENFKGHKVLLLVNRLDLLNSISHVLLKNKIKHSIPQSANELIDFLKISDRGRILVTTLQKVKSIGAKGRHVNKFMVVGCNFNVKELDMFDAFPNSQFVHFTGSPLNSNYDLPIVAIAQYDYKSSINDGYLIPISFDKRDVSIADDYIFGGLSFKQINSYIKSESFLKAIAKDIFQHFKSSRDKFNGKALVVVSDTYAAQFLTDLINELELVSTDEKIAFSVTTNVERKSRNHLIHEFNQEDSKLRIAVVVNMLLIGYDNPQLDTLYIVRELSSHLIWQAMARVNKVFPNKNRALIVDYFNSLERLDIDGEEIV